VVPLPCGDAAPSGGAVEEDDSDQSGGIDGGGGSGGGGGGGDGGGPAPPSIAVATTPPKVAKSILLCTIGIGGVLEAMMPPDGMCDIVFYTHVMCPKCNETKRFTPIGDDTAYKALLVKAQSYSATTFGISLDQA
ncbi:hypothetical protein HPB47_025970, partial [Ixodes persulcatus]